MNAHEKCSMLGFAPTLRAFSKITGDWCVVVMDCVGGELDDAWSKLTAEAQQKFIAEVQVNSRDIHRHKGAIDGAIITVDRDKYMAENL